MTYPGPIVSAVTPRLAIPNQATLLRIIGENFRPGAEVLIGGVSCLNVNVISPQEIRCTYPAEEMTCAPRRVVVVHPDDQKVGVLPEGQGITVYRANFVATGPAFSLPELGYTSEPSQLSRYLKVADVDRDGYLDLVTIRGYWPEALIVRRGDGHGSFALEKSYPLGSNPMGHTVADFNGDGWLDVVVGNPYGDFPGATMLLGDGIGGFAPATSIPQPVTPIQLESADMDGDGLLDLVFLSPSGRIGVLIGDGHGQFAGAKVYSSASGRYFTQAFLRDVNGDGLPDLLAQSFDTSPLAPVFLFLNDSHGGLSIPISLGNLDPLLAFADVDGKQGPDLLGMGTPQQGPAVRLGDGSGQFGSPIYSSSLVSSPLSIPGSKRDPYYGAVAGDLNGDSVPDMLAMQREYYTDPISPNFRWTWIVPLLGDGNGGFVSGFVPATSRSPSPALVPVRLADFDNDGWLDVLMKDSSSGLYQVLLQVTGC